MSLLSLYSVESVSALSQSLRTQWTCPVAMSSAEAAGRGRDLCLCVNVPAHLLDIFYVFLRVCVFFLDSSM